MTAIVTSFPWVRSTPSLLADVPPEPPPPPPLSSSPPHAAANTATPSTISIASTTARSRVMSANPLARWSRVGEVLDAGPHSEDRATARRRLLAGERGILLEHEPPLVPLGVEEPQHLGDPRVPLPERAEHARLGRAHERQLTGAVAGGDARVDVLEVHVDHAIAMLAHEGRG